MKVTLHPSGHPHAYGRCIVEREEGDEGFYSDSRLMYHMKQELNSQGFDFIKKRMWRDGHLVDDSQQYLRERKKGRNDNDPMMIWWPNYSVCNAYPEYNGFVRVTFMYWGKEQGAVND